VLLLPVVLSASACILDSAPLGDGLLLLERDALTWDGDPGRFAALEAGCDRLFGPATSPDGGTVAVWAGSDDRDCILLVRSGGIEVLGPYGEAGLPTWDGEGGLWFTADGELLEGGEPVGLSLDAYHVSVSPGLDRVVYTDMDDRILATSIATGETEVIADSHRFYAPFFTPQGWIVSPSLDGGILLFSGDCAVPVSPGEQPVWWGARGGILFLRTTDDGERLLTSDIWLWTPEGGAECLAETPGVLEIHPVPDGSIVRYVDSATGLPGSLEP